MKTLTHSRLPKPAKGKPKPKPKPRPRPTYEQIYRRFEPSPEPDSWETYQDNLKATHDHAIAGHTIAQLLPIFEDLRHRTDFDDKQERTWVEHRRAAILRRFDAAGLLQ
jgi:hypothetical protein